MKRREFYILKSRMQTDRHEDRQTDKQTDIDRQTVRKTETLEERKNKK